MSFRVQVSIMLQCLMRRFLSFTQSWFRQEGIGSLALQFCILTLTRTDSIRFAEWEQVDLAKGVWTVPSSHMKGGVEFRVALSERAVSLLKDSNTGR